MDLVTCPRCEGAKRLREMIVGSVIGSNLVYRSANLWCWWCRGNGEVSKEKADRWGRS